MKNGYMLTTYAGRNGTQGAAKTYVPLKWSNVLEAQATAYAQDMLSTCGDVPVLDKTEYGENLASNVGTGSWGSFREPEDILIRWVDNQADWGWPGNAHLTQALWRTTEYVGVGSRLNRGMMACVIRKCADMHVQAIVTWPLTSQTRETRSG
ncbi:hypothetical protein ACHAW5_003341 [Stephanodiscus triporus]|uniref:SCP domain-containing protein n=1 Tax=Stephanodiscus triporus TaxID=2934178 RepID=A0ABD3PBL0_9STRA